VQRRDRESTQLRAKAASLDPQMQLQVWDDTAAVTFDQDLWAELTSLRFLADAYNVLIMGPVGVRKTFLANALGHIAVRRHHSVHTERADKLFKRLRGARLDSSYEDERYPRWSATDPQFLAQTEVVDGRAGCQLQRRDPILDLTVCALHDRLRAACHSTILA
jgi:hypothetical protein